MTDGLIPVQPKLVLSMQTRDGVRLDADVYYPDAEGTFPVLLMRQPYGRAIASTVVYAHPTWYAAHGYIVVIQDVRGRGTSEGTFRLFANEQLDGADTVEWAARLPHSTGDVGMYGFSYQGMTQLYAAMEQPKALKTLCPSMIGYDLYEDWAYEGGGFCLQGNLGWAIQLAAETARRAGDDSAYQELYSAGHQGLTDPVQVRSPLLERLAPDSFYHDWIAHPYPDDYWRSLSPSGFPQRVDLPMLHIGGWFDAYLRGTLNFYHQMAAGSAHPQHLWVGPWGHLPWGRVVRHTDYGPAANSPIDRLQIRWFDQFLKGRDMGLLDEPPVQWFEMGRNQWRSLPQFPQPSPHIYCLVSQGLAGIDLGEGRLVLGDRSSAGGGLASPDVAVPDVIVHDPWRPVPAVGGHGAFPAGAGDRTALDCRTDIATYTTDPLPQDLTLAGQIRVSLSCAADTPSFDLCATLSEVDDQGQVRSFSQGYRRMETATPGQIYSVEIQLQATCISIAAGRSLRLSISGACAPSYAVNCGTGAPLSHQTLVQAQIITLSLYSTPEHPSWIALPVLP